MRGDETKRLVEALGFRPMFVGGKLHDVATVVLGSRYGPADQVATDTHASNRSMHSDAFDRSAPPALVCEERCDELDRVYRRPRSSGRRVRTPWSEVRWTSARRIPSGLLADPRRFEWRFTAGFCSWHYVSLDWVMPSTSLTRDQAIRRLLAAEAEIRALGVKRLALFGSVLRGEARPDSDVDILVEFSPGAKTFDRFLDLSELLEDRLERRVELVTLEALSPFIGPRILTEAEDVLRAA
jgi:uncharacterized protein